MFFQRTLVHGDVTPRERAVIRIQAAWRCYTNRRIYRYYRDLINFRNSGDPMVMLRAINPSEASLLDASTNAQVRFRLGGSAFPPTIYYKIFTRGAVCDMNADHLQEKSSDNNTDIVAAAEPAIDFDSPDWEAQATDMFNVSYDAKKLD
ncbi:hypothetical protein DYB31_012797 [Aphanomyces astaci]|uniref:Uncharacterized protein n=1 Tax=Aphanomyces astaci TaxID=112090 RepID=A0A397FVU6_APHAT|nr:hypothetical protein DYB31_012797 [Aphanomyces astaci]